MAKIKGTHKLVLEVLTNNEEARSDDYILILEVLKHFVTSEMSLEGIFTNHNILHIPSIETITRCRRKIQEQRPDLASDKMRQIRGLEQEEYKQYALDID